MIKNKKMNVRPSYISIIDNTISSCNKLKSNALHHYWTTLRIPKKHKVLPEKWKWIEAPAKKYARFNPRTKRAQLGRINLILAKSDAFINAYTEYEHLKLFCLHHIKLVDELNNELGWQVSTNEFHASKCQATINLPLSKMNPMGISLFTKLGYSNNDYTDYITIAKWAPYQFTLAEKYDLRNWETDDIHGKIPGKFIMRSPKEGLIIYNNSVWKHNENILD